jgi:type II secretory pathway component PulM
MSRTRFASLARTLQAQQRSIGRTVTRSYETVAPRTRMGAWGTAALTLGLAAVSPLHSDF